MDPKITHREGFFSAKDNLRLYWQAFTPPEPRAVVGVIHGYADHSNRFLPLFDYLTGQGYAAYSFDYRGHGQADGRRGHCDQFSDYLGDLELFVERAAAEAKGKKLFLVGHSHGALMLAKHALGRPAGITGTVYSSAYLKLALTPPALKVAMATLVGKVVPWLPITNELKIEQLTRDPEVRRVTERDPLYNRKVTPRWFSESNAAQAEVIRRSSELALPSLTLVPEADSIADPAAMRTFHASITAQDKQLRSYPGAFHELFNELPETRGQVLADLGSWLASRA